MDSCLLSYNGERRDPVSGCFHPGNGYRAYHPQLMRFSHPDDFSPFGAGGINAYVYCIGDPINRADPSGHSSWQAWLGVGTGVLGLLAAIFTGGISLAAEGGLLAALNSASVMSIMTGATGVVADAGGIASVLTAGKDPKASGVLGWVALACGILSGISAISPSVLNGRGVLDSFPRSTTVVLAGGENLLPVSSSAEYEIIAGQRVRCVNAIFDDSYKGGKRLNVIGHGFLVDSTDYAMLTDDRLNFYPGHVFAEYLRDHLQVNFADYQYARMVMCHSAAGGENSFAAGFARVSHLPVKGYTGRVVAREAVSPYLRLLESENYSTGMKMSVADMNRRIRLQSADGFELLSVIKNMPTHPYLPVYFDAAGIQLAGDFKRL